MSKLRVQRFAISFDGHSARLGHDREHPLRARSPGKRATDVVIRRHAPA